MDKRNAVLNSAQTTDSDIEAKIENIIIDNAILGVDSGQAYFVDLDQVSEKIAKLINTSIQKAKVEIADSHFRDCVETGVCSMLENLKTLKEQIPPNPRERTSK